MRNVLYYMIKGTAAVTLSDSEDIDPQYSHGVLVKAAGNVAVEYEDGSQETYSGLAKFDTIKGIIKKVLATGTTVAASNLRLVRFKGYE